MPRYTPSGKKTKLGDFEDKVSAASLPGGEREKYAIANKVGLMRGNQATSKGRRPMKAGKSAKQRSGKSKAWTGS
jgi:hypothetical protein